MGSCKYGDGVPLRVPLKGFYEGFSGLGFRGSYKSYKYAYKYPKMGYNYS